MSGEEDDGNDGKTLRRRHNEVMMVWVFESEGRPRSNNFKPSRPSLLSSSVGRSCLSVSSAVCAVDTKSHSNLGGIDTMLVAATDNE